MNRLALAIASVFGLGLSPLGPGTLGSMVGVALAYGTLGWALGAKLTILVVVSLVGWWASIHAGRAWGHDDQRIVIDEVAGQYLTALAAPSLGWLLVGLVLFRVFDMAKPFPASLLDRKKGGFYTMADDLAAGVYGLVVLLVLVAIWPAG